MNGVPQNAPAWVYLIPLAFVALAIWRNARGRRLRIERMWIAPVVILLMTGLAFSQQKPPGLMPLFAFVALFVAGAAVGWWRGRLTNITIDPETHALTSKASPVGMLLILGIFAIRYALRGYAEANAGALHVSTTEITDGFLLFAVGLVCAQRLEMALRASRLLRDARA